jgi:ADP-heptose:LPS heptosyltransferase
VLVMRLDQLGDFVCSVPALRRLREFLPDARLVGLIDPANVELEASLGLFDEVVTAEFKDDPLEKRRVMTLADQFALRKRLHAYKFDVAIDLSASELSRPILKLSGAPFLYGFRHNDIPWLSADFDGMVRDPINGQDVLPHTTKIMGLLEWFGMLAQGYSSVVRRPDLSLTDLEPYGLAAGEKFVLMHTGARLWFSRWPHYLDLAATILDRTPFRVVMISDTQDERAKLPDTLASSSRFQLLDRRLPFRDFDALVSFCSAFVGNDSGPKHLASLRGAPVISIHMARNVWSEWGQENSGFIFSRRVPCAGCSIHHEPEECGKGFPCVTQIAPEEVFEKLLALVGDPVTSPA